MNQIEEAVNRDNPMLRTIENLFLTHKLALFGRIDRVSEQQSYQVLAFLEDFYNEESIDYPSLAPKLHDEVAIWSSKILFHAAQLVMYREHKAELLSDLFPKYELPKTAASIVTADLSLRYLPSILKYLEHINVEDELIPILKEILNEWHYSGLLADVPLEIVETSVIKNDPCLSQLYVNRIIQGKKKEVGQMEGFKSLITSNLGDHGNVFWKDFNLTP